MSLKYKIFTAFILFIIILSAAGGIYCADASSFDNRKQYILAESLFADKKYQESYAAFLKVKFFSPYYKPALYKQALSAERLGDWPIAETKYSQYVKFFPDSLLTPGAQYALAKAYYFNKNYDKAKSAFLKLRTQSPIPDYVTASDYFLGKINLHREQQKDAKTSFFTYLNKVPSGTYSLAVAYDVKNLELSDSERIIISKIFLSNGKYEEAEQVLKGVPKQNCWTYLAMAAYYKNDIKTFDSLADEGFIKYPDKVADEDFRAFADFYFSRKQDADKILTKYIKAHESKPVRISDCFVFKHAGYLPDDKRIAEYIKIVKRYPKSKYLPECLHDIFFDFAQKGDINSALKTAVIYFEKFPDTVYEPELLFWAGKYADRLGKKEDSKKYYNTAVLKYPDSYFAFRSERAEFSPKSSWNFDKKRLPDKIKIPFPAEGLKKADIELINLFISVGDNTIWDSIPFNSLAVKAWYEYRRGNFARSVYLADKYIKESSIKPDYSHPVWKLAFPIHYADYINPKSVFFKLDPFLVLSLIREESHFREDARSSSDALGLMQLLFPTAEYIASLNGLSAPDEVKLCNPEYNIALGTAYLRHVLNAVDDFPMYAIGGYNGGPNAMNKWRKTYITPDFDEFIEAIPYAESKNYIKKVYRSRYNYSKIYR